jgi:hypothetical protein
MAELELLLLRERDWPELGPFWQYLIGIDLLTRVMHALKRHAVLHYRRAPLRRLCISRPPPRSSLELS